MQFPKQNRLNIAQKYSILKKLDGGIRANRLAIDFKVSEAAISLIKKQKMKILEAVSKNQESSRKTLHKAEFEELEERLYEWIVEQREQNRLINGSILKAKAKKMFTKIYPNRHGDDFLASDGWFSKFKRRHGFRFLKNIGAHLKNDTSIRFVEQLQPTVIQNKDEQQKEDPRILHKDAINAINTLIKWNEINRSYSNKHIFNLLSLRSDIMNQSLCREITVSIV